MRKRKERYVRRTKKKKYTNHPNDYLFLPTPFWNCCQFERPGLPAGGAAFEFGCVSTGSDGGGGGGATSVKEFCGCLYVGLEPVRPVEGGGGGGVLGFVEVNPGDQPPCDGPTEEGNGGTLLCTWPYKGGGGGAAEGGGGGKGRGCELPVSKDVQPALRKVGM